MTWSSSILIAVLFAFGARLIPLCLGKHFHEMLLKPISVMWLQKPLARRLRFRSVKDVGTEIGSWLRVLSRDPWKEWVPVPGRRYLWSYQPHLCPVAGSPSSLKPTHPQSYGCPKEVVLCWRVFPYPVGVVSNKTPFLFQKARLSKLQEWKSMTIWTMIAKHNQISCPLRLFEWTGMGPPLHGAYPAAGCSGKNKH